MEKATMHCHQEIEQDLKNHTFISDETLFKWFQDRYSTSKHLLTLYTIARGLNAKNIIEIGFGRSSFALARAAHENNGHFTVCETRNFSYLLSKEELNCTTYEQTHSGDFWKRCPPGIDFAFLDYFSDEHLDVKFCLTEIKECLSRMKTNGVIALHDVIVEKYPLQKAIKKLSGKRDIEFMALPYNYGLGLMRYTGKSKYGALEDSFIKKPEPENTK